MRRGRITPGALLAAALALTPARARADDLANTIRWRWRDLRGSVGAFAQAQLELNSSSEPAVSDDGRRLLDVDRFALRRANVLADVAGPWFALALETTASTLHGGTFALSQGHATLRLPRDPDDGPAKVALSAGLLRVPFGWHNRVGARVWGFVEAPLAARALFPGQSDLGASVHGAIGWFRYDLAWMNGHPVGDRSFPLLAPNGPRDGVGRVGVVASALRGALRVEGGVSALYGEGFSPGAPATPDVIAYRDVNQTGVLDPANLVLIPGRPAIAARTFARWAAGVDLVVRAEPLRAWRFEVVAEAVYALNLDRGVEPADPVASSRDLRELGWSVGTVHTLFDRAVLGVRVDGYDPDVDARARVAGRVVPADRSYLTASFLLGLALSATNRLVAQYDLVVDHLAVDTSGRPTDQRNDAFTARLQVGL